MSEKRKITNIRIVKRTFEGRNDESKNDNPVTSKYSPSKKYAILYDLIGYDYNPICECVDNNEIAELTVAQMKIYDEVIVH